MVDLCARCMGSVDDFVERAFEMRAWALSRIEQCRREEAKFGAGGVAVEAACERRTLEAALRVLGFDDATTGEKGRTTAPPPPRPSK